MAEELKLSGLVCGAWLGPERNSPRHKETNNKGGGHGGRWDR
jgi:hypothetical protein